LNSRNDQIEIARVAQSKFADGTPAIPQQKRWSGFKLAGTFELAPGSVIILRNGEKGGPTVADCVLFEEVRPGESVTERTQPQLRAPVSHRENIEAFDPVMAKFVRFTALACTTAEPCIDELEVFTAEKTPRNVALASLGARATASGTYANGTNIKHNLAHVHDGRYGNDFSWISDEKGKGWVQLEFAKPERINRVVWSRDRGDGKKAYDDRLASEYVIEVSLDGQAWRRVSSHVDRVPISYRDTIKTHLHAARRACGPGQGGGCARLARRIAAPPLRRAHGGAHGLCGQI